MVSLGISIGDLNYSNDLIFYSGNGTLTRRVVGEEEFYLSTVSLSGANDLSPSRSLRLGNV